jgi:hypothetical protein
LRVFFLGDGDSSQQQRQSHADELFNPECFQARSNTAAHLIPLGVPVNSTADATGRELFYKRRLS